MLDSRVRRDLMFEYERLLADPKSSREFLSQEELDRAYATFRREFGPDVLAGLEGRDLLLKMHDRGTASLMYWLEFKNDDELPRVFGSISGGSALKFQLFKRARDGAWITGSPKDQRRIDENEAVALATRQRDLLLHVTRLLESVADPMSTQPYQAIQTELDQLDYTFCSLAWVHKYLHLCFPTKVDDYHNVDYQRFHLLKSLIPPAEGWGRYLSAPLYMRFANEVGLTVNHLSSLLNAVQGEPSRWYRLRLEQFDISDEQAAEMIALGVLSLGCDELPDLSDLPSNRSGKDWLKDQVPTKYMEIWRFLNYCSKRDRVLVVGGHRRYLADVTGSYEFAAGAGSLRHRRSARWYELPDSFDYDEGSLNASPFAEIQNSHTELILGIEEAARIAPEAKVAPSELPHPETKVEPLDGVRGRVQQGLERRRQVILYGPPGTGKTYWATGAARELASRHRFGRSWGGLSDAEREIVWGTSDSLVRFCTFHPAYGYEDFIEGFRPRVSDDEQLVFDLVPGVFQRICADAEVNPDHRYYLLIDEINRGDIPRIFGELISLIESDKRGALRAQLPLSGESFSVPKNVYVIGTMNTADRSIVLLDSALRRRFGFIELMPDPSALGDATIGSFRLSDFLTLLNERIVSSLGDDGRNLQVGHAYLLLDGEPVSSVRSFATVLDEEIFPLLQEYCYGRLDLLETILGGQLMDTDGSRISPALLELGNEEAFLGALFTAFQELGETATEDGDSDVVDELGSDPEAEASE